jgi:hypothetical protein
MLLAVMETTKWNSLPKRITLPMTASAFMQGRSQAMAGKAAEKTKADR